MPVKTLLEAAEVESLMRHGAQNVTSAGIWEGEPVNAEPHKRARVEWFPLDRLPPDTYLYTAAGVERYRQGAPYAAVWSTSHPG